MCRRRSCRVIVGLLGGCLLLGAVQPARTQDPAAPLTPAQLEAIWKDLLPADDAGTRTAWKGVAALARSPRTAVPFLRDRLKPVPPADRPRIEQSLKDLDSTDFQKREEAGQKLLQIGETAVAAMHQRLQGKPSLEVRERLEKLLQQIESRPLTADELRAGRALEALAHMNAPEARALLEALAQGGAGAKQTEDARALLRAAQAMARK
jgi:hypothetical protein